MSMFLRSKFQDIMLRKRSRAVSSKQSLMSDAPSLPYPTSSSLFTCPRLFVGYSPPISVADPESAVSPTSILETQPFCAIRNPFFLDRNPTKALLSATITPTTANESKHLHQENGDPRATGFGLLDALTNKDSAKSTSRPEKRMVVFGSQLKIQIPPPPPPPTKSSSILAAGSGEPLKSPVEFGINTRNPQLALCSSNGTGDMVSDMLNSSPRVFTGCLPPPEMELSEDYTCVILRGPNPRTTHIFDNCIIESCGSGFVTAANENRSNDRSGYTGDYFLSFCYGCKRKIGPWEDIYMYRGDKAFCSHECRNQEMLSDEENEKC